MRNESPLHHHPKATRGLTPATAARTIAEQVLPLCASLSEAVALRLGRPATIEGRCALLFADGSALLSGARGRLAALPSAALAHGGFELGGW